MKLVLLALAAVLSLSGCSAVGHAVGTITRPVTGLLSTVTRPLTN